MNRKINLLLLFLFLSLSIQTFAENEPDETTKSNKGAITGRIIDEQNLPLPGATVLIKSLNTGVISDVDGFYRINRLDPGIYDVEVSYIGFKDITQKILNKGIKLNVILPKKLKLKLELQQKPILY